MRYQPKEISYPQTNNEYRIVTPTGVIHCAYNDKKLALDRLRKCPLTWKLVQVTVHQEDVTPRRNTKSAVISKIGKDLGIPVIDLTLAIAS